MAKTIFKLLLLLIIFDLAAAQSVTFEYDAAGNRVKRSSGPDLRPLIVMPDAGFIKPSALTKNAELRLYNVGGPSTIASGLIAIYIYPPSNNFTIALGNPSIGWSIIYNAAGNYYTLSSTTSSIPYGSLNFKAIPLTINALPTVSNGKYATVFEVADGSGGETNNLNNTIGIELVVSGL